MRKQRPRMQLQRTPLVDATEGTACTTFSIGRTRSTASDGGIPSTEAPRLGFCDERLRLRCGLGWGRACNGMPSGRPKIRSFVEGRSGAGGLQQQCAASKAPASGRTRTPVKASTQRGGSPRQADRSPAWNRRRLRRGHTGWEVAGAERPVRNHVPCLTGHTLNPIRPRRPASLPVLCPRASMQNVFCMGTQARAMTHVGSCPSACGQGSLACGPLQRKA